MDERQFDNRTTRGAPGGADSLFFSFMLRDGTNFSFVYHNTAGALKEGIGRNFKGTPEDGQRLIGLLEALGPTDVQLGTAATGNFDNNGLRDLIMYQQAIQPTSTSRTTSPPGRAPRKARRCRSMPAMSTSST